MNIIKSYQLYLNTKRATSGTSNNCNFSINPPITLSNSNHRFMISCRMVELPYTFNQLNSAWTTLNATYNVSNFSIVFNTGNYNINDLILALISSLNFNLGTTSSSYNITYSSTTSKVSFQTVGLPFSITLKFSQNEVLGIMFGCPNDIIFNTGTAVVSTNKINVNPVSSVFIRSDSIKLSTAFEAVSTQYRASSIIAKIPVNTLPNSIIYYRNDFNSELVVNQSISNLNLFLTDNLNTNELDLNGVNYGMLIIVDEVHLEETGAEDDKINTTNVANDLIERKKRLLEELILTKNKLQSELNI